MDNETRNKICEMILEGLPVGLFMVDENFNIIEFNTLAEKFTGWRKEEALGRQCSEVLQSSLCHRDCPLLESARGDRGFFTREASIKTKMGNEIPIVFCSAALEGDGGQIGGGLELFVDASDSKRLQAQRKNLISLFAHDLKAPVSIGGAFLNRLIRGKAGELNGKQREYLQAALNENRKLDRSIRSFLDLLRMEAGQINLSPETVSVESFLHDVVEPLEVKAREKGMGIVFDFPDTLVTARFDRQQLERVVLNLVENAIKYSPPDTTIVVRYSDGGDFIRFEVRDQGPGISAEERPHVFDYFYRSNRSRDKTGVGLGLASAKTIVEAHGGRIWVEADPSGGSAFIFTIPKEP